MSVNSFRPTKFEDFIIVRGKRRMGHIRVKPSGVHWSPAYGKGWYGVSLSKFAKFMETEGRRRKK